MLKVHFLNVGHGESTIIAHPSGRLTMVDINTSHEYDWETQQEILAEQQGALIAAALGIDYQTYAREQARQTAERELTDPVEFLQRNYPGRTLFRFVLTHPDLDHMRGLQRLRETVGFHNFWDVNHTKQQPTFRGDKDRDEWNHYQLLRRGDFGHETKFYTRGIRKFAFGLDANGSGFGDGIEILSPTHELVSSCNAAGKSNDLSYVLRIWHGGTSVLLTGDIEKEAWENIGAAYGNNLKSDILQASHHGRDSGYHLETLQMIAPRIVVVSVGRKPDTDASRKYCLQCQQVISTRYYGNLELQIADTGETNWLVDRNGMQ